ncbi:hypothetical protein MNBD_GAMMA12-619 [hydrothermal vent metagenome]|uniref:Uncharacterized protein n=1 Tax=hydrothermal vent metagenome TaxID=652676 RepID=A0A3B0Z4F5_9ZZZZ
MKPQEKIAITNIIVETCLGSEIHDVHGALLTNMSLAKPYKNAEIDSDLEEKTVASICHVIDKYQSTFYMDRLNEIFSDILPKLTQIIAEDLLNKRILILHVTPNNESARSSIVDLDYYKDIFSDYLDLESEEGEKIKVHFISDNECVIEHLNKAFNQIQDNKCDAVIVGGVDSLVNIITCHELYDDKNLKCEDQIAGTSPGEAAAYVVFKNQVVAETEGNNIFSVIEKLSFCAEPNSRKAGSSKLIGLSQTLKNISPNSQNVAENIKALFTSISTYRPEVLEWHQVTQQLISEDQKSNNRVTTITEAEPIDEVDDDSLSLFNSQVSLGDIGSATVPMLIASAAYHNMYEHELGNYGFESNNNEKKNVVCEMGYKQFRGSISLNSVELTQRKCFSTLVLNEEEEQMIPELKEENSWVET